MSDSVSVQVALRVRPLVDSEISRGCQLCLECVPNEPQVVVKGTDKAFTFNYVFRPDDDNQYLYETAVKDLVSHVFKGYNVTILAYGQTGSGKTYSMGTSYNGGENLGVIPLAVTDIFETVEKMKDIEFKITVTFMELYQEQLFDLLDTYKSVVDIREDIRGIIVPRLTEVAVRSTAETIKCLNRGSSGRCTGATAMNAQSSRSHAIFTITVSQQFKADENNNTTSKFHLVDLAGSERSKKTKATGERFKEGININRGLLALGNVISALGDESQKGYISYRDSKLTRLLQDSLGGNSLTLMLACVSPADYNLDETLSTLRYADRARRIRNKPVVNQDPTAALIAKLKQELHEAQARTSNIKRNCLEEHLLLQEENKHYLNENKKLEKLKLKADVAVASIRDSVYRSESANNHCLVKLQEIQTEFNNTIHNISKLVNSKPCSPNVKEHLKCLQELQEKIKNVQDEPQSSEEEMFDKKYATDNAYSQNNFPTSPYTLSDNILPQISANERESHILQYIVLNKELTDQCKSLELKEKLAAQLIVNSDRILNLNPDHEITVRNLDSQVQALQKEKDQLQKTLEESKNSCVNEDDQGKIYREKLSALKEKISFLNEKITNQNELIKMKGKARQKISHLNNEITSMKESKLRILKQMKTESSQFKKWNIECEREISKLLDKDRKSQTQLVHMEKSFAKEQDVWKKKVEQTTEVKMRLKEALAVQRSSQEGATSNARVQTRILRELELMYRVMDAQKTLDELLKDRIRLTEKLETLSANLTSVIMLEEDKNKVQQEMEQLSKSICARNTQIEDLHQKIIDCDIENKNNMRWDYIQSLPVSKCALKLLFNIATEMKREKANSEERLEELVMKVQTKESVIRNTEMKIKERALKIQQEIICLEKEQEEKVFILLKHLSGAGDAPTYNEVLKQVFNRQRRIEDLIAMVIEDEPSGLPGAQNHLTENEEAGDDAKGIMWQTTPVFKRIQDLKIRKSEDIEEKEKPVKRTLDGNSKYACRTKAQLVNRRRVGSLCSPARKWNFTDFRNIERDSTGKCENNKEENVIDNVKKPRSLNLGEPSNEHSASHDAEPLADEVGDGESQKDYDTKETD